MREFNHYKKLSGYIGKTIGSIEVLSIYDSVKFKPKILARCACGFEFVSDTWRLSPEKRNDCSYCLKTYRSRVQRQFLSGNKIKTNETPEKDDIYIGFTNNRLTVLDYRGPRYRPSYLVKCRCGAKLIISKDYLLRDKNGCKMCVYAENRQIAMGIPVIV